MSVVVSGAISPGGYNMNIEEMIPTLCAALGTWLILNGIGIDLSILYPLGYTCISLGIKMRARSK